ncbi:PLP-dependent transferase [uncultured Oscillibacter sp.]|uniref:PLP-dependent transferase n=1 Tax=uncultured Oscillibacter sp. TaxID=876091 RepID=UPI00261D1073|nr:PLP-dependent transferase [uncultured Oscillibacter sp.]
MDTPIADFIRDYTASGVSRLHMPGHKGVGPLGCEAWDITEVRGADSLYEASGVIAESEGRAARLFGSGATFYSTGGSSQCVRAMLYLALQNRPAGTVPVVAAARNVHKSFVYAAALLDFAPLWLWPEGANPSICSCPVTARGLEAVLAAMDAPPAAVYVTSPDYLGNCQDIAALAAVCHARGTVLAVDNAHGAYLRFLEPSRHPLDLGADICCDSAHKTLPVLTGGAYLHIGKNAPAGLRENARAALALFGSTSPSYLTMASLDLCNGALAEEYPARLRAWAARVEGLRERLRAMGWTVCPSDPLRLTLDAAASGLTGLALAELLRQGGAECEYADGTYTVLMATPENREEDLERVLHALGKNRRPPLERAVLPPAKGEQAMSARQALFAPQETVPAAESLGRVCGAPTVSCPPAIPIAVSGERIGPEALALFRHYGVEAVDVVRQG